MAVEVKIVYWYAVGEGGNRAVVFTSSYGYIRPLVGNMSESKTLSPILTLSFPQRGMRVRLQGKRT